MRPIAPKTNVDWQHADCLLGSEYTLDQCHGRLLASYLQAVKNHVEIIQIIKYYLSIEARFIFLANSLRAGGRCFAGIGIDDYNKLIWRIRVLGWIRSIYNTEYMEVPEQLVKLF